MRDTRTRGPWTGRWLLRLCRLGERRTDIESDLLELLNMRRATRGRAYAWRRFVADAFSVWMHPPRETVSVSDVPRTRSRWYVDVLPDVIYATRVFRRQAGVVSMAVTGLAVAIGLTTTAFSAANANLKPVGVPEPAEAFKVTRTMGASRIALEGWPFAEFLTMQAAARTASLEASAASRPHVSDSAADDSGSPVVARFVTERFLDTFGGRTMLGRLPGPEDHAPGAQPVAMLSHEYWRTRLGSDTGVVGRLTYLNGKPVTIIGVMKADFTGPFESNRQPALWLPLAAADAIDPYAGPFNPSSVAPVDVVGRLRSSATRSQVESEISPVVAALPKSSSGATASGVIVESVKRELDANDLLMLTMILTVVGLVVVLASTNVANVLMASATMRQKEIGTRLALGASRGRIVRQLLTESLFLGGLAGAIGLLMTGWMSRLALSLSLFPPGMDFAPDGRVYLFVTVISVLAGVLSGLTPALQGVRGRLGGTLRNGSRARSIFLGVQAAASAVLLVLTALFTRSMLEVAARQPGFDPDHLVSVSAFAPRSGSVVPDQEFFTAALERLEAVPGVEAAALVEHPPFDSSFTPAVARLNGSPYRLVRNLVGPKFFEVAGFRLLQGRIFTEAEVAAQAKVAVITEGVARDFWPDGDVVGSSLERVKSAYKDLQVVGVVTDAVPHIGAPAYSGAQAVYLPLSPRTAPRIVVSTSGDNVPLRAIRDVVAALDSARVVTANLARTDMERTTQWPRMLASMAAIVGGVALLLAVIGVFGVTAFVVQSRKREIGIRLAIGATRQGVVLTMYRQGMKPVVIGLAVGLGLALLGSQMFSWALYAGTSARDPLAFVVAAGVVLLSTGLGVFLPARRAAGVDPALSLRVE